jgi:hypothetical protein
MNIAAMWFGCSNAAREIVAEWAVFSRERVIGLRLIAYLASKFGVLSVVGLAQCLLLLAIVRHGCRIEAPSIELLLSLFLSTLTGAADRGRDPSSAPLSRTTTTPSPPSIRSSFAGRRRSACARIFDRMDTLARS